MSKFVTYPAVTVLDNDHSLLIDDPNAGTNSITAENAGNTLLSKWAGFETFDEAVQNTIEHNQEFIDRDTAIREETAELKKKIVTTFPAKDASGAIATFESEFEDAPLKSCIVRVNPVQDLHGYDSPWPAGGRINKLDMGSVVVQSSYGLTVSKDADGFFNIVGTYNGNASNPSYAIATKGSVPFDENMRFLAFDKNADAESCISQIRFTDSDGGIAVDSKPVMVNGQSYNMRFRVVECSRSETPTSWSPYSNECPITGWTGCEVQRTGKNLFDKNNTANILNNADMSEATIRFGTYRCVVFIPCKPNQTYIASRKAVLTNDRFMIGYTTAHPAVDVAFKNAARAPYAQTIGNLMSLSVTTGSDAKYVIVWAYWDNKIEALDDLQIELGSTATDYAPYTGQTYPITFPTEAGTVYGAYVDVTGGELVVDRYFANISTVVNKNIKEGTGYFWFNTSGNIGIPAIKGTNAKLISNRFAPCYNVHEGAGDGLITFYANNIIRWKEHGEMTLAEYKAYLAENPFELCYELAEPIHYPLTPTEIKTLLGQNNLWADTGDISVEHLMSDVSWYVEKKLRAFQSILAGVEDSAVASKNYSTDSYLIFNDDIYRVTKTITAGETIEDGVNVTKTTVAEQLMALAQV